MKNIANPSPKEVIGRASECMRRLLEAGLPFEALQKPIDDPEMRKRLVRFWISGGIEPSTKKKEASSIRAIRILGEFRVFTPEKVAEAFNPLRQRAGLPLLVPPQGISVPCSDEILRKHVGGKWLLVYSYGLSLREQRQMVGTDSNQQPCFRNNDWWLKPQENDWATRGAKPGWHLVSLEGRFGNQFWQSQEESIRKEFGTDYERADEHLMGEVALSAYLINKGERLLENFYHWGKALDSLGDRVCVGGFNRDGWSVSSDSPGYDVCSYLRVCLSRKFQ